MTDNDAQTSLQTHKGLHAGDLGCRGYRVGRIYFNLTYKTILIVVPKMQRRSQEQAKKNVLEMHAEKG